MDQAFAQPSSAGGLVQITSRLNRWFGWRSWRDKGALDNLARNAVEKATATHANDPPQGTEMPEVSTRAIMMAIQAVHAEIIRIVDDQPIAELDPDDQALLPSYSRAAEEFKAAYLDA